MVYCLWISALKLMLLVLLLSNQIGSCGLAWEARYLSKGQNIVCVSGRGLSVRPNTFCLEVGKHLYYRLQAQWLPDA